MKENLYTCSGKC